MTMIQCMLFGGSKDERLVSVARGMWMLRVLDGEFDDPAAKFELYYMNLVVGKKNGQNVKWRVGALTSQIDPNDLPMIHQKLLEEGCIPYESWDD